MHLLFDFSSLERNLMAQGASATLIDNYDVKSAASDKVLPLVVEILPGQAGEGLIDIFEPGSYSGIPVRELIYGTLHKKGWSIEEAQILDDINRQLAGGKLLIRGKEIRGTAFEHAVLEETDEGEKYLYISVRAIRPQEGGV